DAKCVCQLRWPPALADDVKRGGRKGRLAVPGIEPQETFGEMIQHGGLKKAATVTSTFKMLRPEDVWHPRVGAPPGNRNRLKTGYHTRACKELRRHIAQWRRETNVLMARAQREGARRELAKT